MGDSSGFFKNQLKACGNIKSTDLASYLNEISFD
jgi:hypothetical protein